MSLLSVRDLYVRRGQVGVLRGINLEVNAGELVSILGGNGVGKSTTLRTISGLHKPTSGAIRFADHDIGGSSPRKIVREGICHVPEGRQVFPALTVRENLEMGAYARGRSFATRLDQIVALFPILETKLNQHAGALSGGQQQMLAIGRGIIGQPRLLLLDEPSLGLAPLIIQTIRDTLLKLKQEGTTILLVEQNAALALTVADRGYVMVDGVITLEGAAEELRENKAVRDAYLGV